MVRSAAVGLVLAAVLTGCGGAPERVPEDAQEVTVVRIVDGDTVTVRAREDGVVPVAGDPVRVRLLQIDTPEVGECYADEATGRTAELLPVGGRAYVRPDRELLDRYDRHLLHIWNADGVWVNADLVENGYAESLVVHPNDAHIDHMRDLERRARQAGEGLWGACPA